MWLWLEYVSGILWDVNALMTSVTGLLQPIVNYSNWQGEIDLFGEFPPFLYWGIWSNPEQSTRWKLEVSGPNDFGAQFNSGPVGHSSGMCSGLWTSPDHATMASPNSTSCISGASHGPCIPGRYHPQNHIKKIKKSGKPGSRWGRRLAAQPLRSTWSIWSPARGIATPCPRVCSRVTSETISLGV